MSAKYTFLAWDTPIENAPLKLALLQLANNADDDGFSYYSISKMAIACGMSERTFMRKIAELEKKGILTVERRANRPSLYTLIGDEMGVTLCHLQQAEVTECHGEVSESHPLGDRESHDPNSVPKSNPKSILFDPMIRFNDFWEMYGKKVARPKCELKFKRLKEDQVNKIFESLPLYVASTPNIKYRKNPLTWLNGECWNDEIQVQLPGVNSHLDFDQLVVDFNNAFEHKEFVPVAIKVAEVDRNVINNTAIELNIGNNGFKQYFERCANSEQFDYVTNGVNMKAQGINYFLKEKTILQGIA